MHLKAIHTIHRAPKGVQSVVQPGDEFECPDAEGQDYLALRAATVIEAPELPLEAETKVEAKAPAAKKSTKKAEPAPAPAPASTPASEETVAGGENSDDMLD